MTGAQGRGDGAFGRRPLRARLRPLIFLAAIVHAEGAAGNGPVHQLQPQLAGRDVGPIIDDLCAYTQIAECLNCHECYSRSALHSQSAMSHRELFRTFLAYSAIKGSSETNRIYFHGWGVCSLQRQNANGNETTAATSVIGTSRTCQPPRSRSGFGGKAEVTPRGRQVRVW